MTKDIHYNGNLDDLFDSVNDSVRDSAPDAETCIFRFVRLNRSLKSTEEMAHEILQYGWSDTYENALSSIRENLLFDERPQGGGKVEPPSLFDHFDFN